MGGYNYTRYIERILIAGKRTHSLVSTFAQKNLSQTEVSEMKALINKHAPFVNELIGHLTLSSCSTTCPEPWKKFLRSFSASSPVCALIHSNERELHDILTDIANNKKRILDFCSSNFVLYLTAMKTSGECNTLQHILSFLVPELLTAHLVISYQKSLQKLKTLPLVHHQMKLPQLPIVRNRDSCCRH